MNNGPLLSKVTYPTHFLAAADSRSSFVPPARRLIHRLHSHQAKHRHLVLYFSFQVVSLAIISFVIIPFDGSYSFHALVYPLVHKEVHFLPQTPTCNQKITCLNVHNGASCNHIAIDTLFIVLTTLKRVLFELYSIQRHVAVNFFQKQIPVDIPEFFLLERMVMNDNCKVPDFLTGRATGKKKSY